MDREPIRVGGDVTLASCKLVDLPVVEDPQGNLAFAEAESHVPFPIARSFHVYGIPAGAQRGGHSHRTLEQVVFCLSGSFEIVVDDGERRQPFLLDDPSAGLYLPPLVWHDMGRFESGTVYTVLASAAYDESDYIRDYDAFRSAVRALTP